MATKNTKTQSHKSTLYTLLLDDMQPLIDALNMDVGEGDADNGTEHPSQRDVGIRIVLGGMCQIIHNQLHGDFTTSTGSKIVNVYRRFKDSEDQIGSKDFQERLADGTMTKSDMYALDWFEKNEARFNWLSGWDNDMKQLYENVTGEKWKPYVKPVEDKAAVDRRKAAIEKAKQYARK